MPEEVPVKSSLTGNQTMKTLFIVRHGKSSWDYETVKDIDRPLGERGIHDAEKVAGRLRKSGRKPELMISSPATRALHTATIFQRILEIPDKNFKIDSEHLPDRYRQYYESALRD